MQKIISKTINGKIFKCSSCNLLHIEYKNLNFNFNIHDFKSFSEYIRNIDGKTIESKNINSLYNKKIMISLGKGNFNILLDNNELDELKELFNYSSKPRDKFRLTPIQNMNFTSYLN